MKGFRPGVAIFIIIAEVDAIMVPLIVGVKHNWLSIRINRQFVGFALSLPVRKYL